VSEPPADKPSGAPSSAVTLAGIVLAVPTGMLWFALGRNEYVFPAWGRYLAVAAAVLVWAGVRVAGKRPAHLPSWVLVALGIYNLHLAAAGYLYLSLWAPLPALAIAAGVCLAFRRRDRLWRALNALHLVLLAGIVLFMMHNQYYFLDESQRCADETARLPSAVQAIVGSPLHPYDLGGARGAAQVGVAFGKTSHVYLLRLSDLTVHRGGEIQTGVQRVTPHPRQPLLAMPAWAHWGQDESVYLVDARTGDVHRRVPVPGCRNAFEVEFLDDRMYVLCEVSHSLHELSAEPPYEQRRMLVLPGMNSYDLAIDHATRRAYVSDWLSPYLTEVDLTAFTLLRRQWIGWVSFGVALGPDGMLYVAQPLHRRVQVIDVHGMTTVRSIAAGYGARDLTFDARRGLLLVGNYFDGTLDIVRLADGAGLQRVFVGDLLRGLWLDEAGDRLLMAVGCGVRVVDVPVLVTAQRRDRRPMVNGAEPVAGAPCAVPRRQRHGVRFDLHPHASVEVVAAPR